MGGGPGEGGRREKWGRGGLKIIYSEKRGALKYFSCKRGWLLKYF